jgi:ribA/ribD-fused uncharacterized protein
VLPFPVISGRAPSVALDVVCHRCKRSRQLIATQGTHRIVQMATDMGVLILSAEGKLRREAAAVFQSISSGQLNAGRGLGEQAAAGGGGSCELSAATLYDDLVEFGFSGEESEGIAAVTISQGDQVALAAFCDAYVLVKGQPAAEGVDLTCDAVHCYYNHAGEPLSNFYPCTPAFTIGNTTFETVEHYYQYMKHACNDAAYAERIRTSSVAAAHHLGGANRASFRADWEQVRDDVYYNGMLAKFSQNAELQRVLLQTGDKMLVQVDSDAHWGMCVPDDTPAGLAHGGNAGGRALQRVRAHLLRSSSSAAADPEAASHQAPSIQTLNP